MEKRYSIAPHGCGACGETVGLLRCKGCLVVHYCSKEYQKGHRLAHKAACNAIKKTRQALEREETKLRSKPGDMLLPADIFETHAVNNVAAVEKALDHFTDMLRLCQSDNLGVRDIVPFLHLRVGQEQECYDFLKWWATAVSAWGDMTLPYLDIRNADAFEPVDNLVPNMRVAHLVALTLLKLRLYLDLNSYEVNTMDYGLGYLSLSHFQGPNLLIRPIGKLVRSRLPSWDDMLPSSQKLKSQYLELCQAVHHINAHIRPGLVDQSTEPTLPEYYSVGSLEEANLVLCTCKRAWDETDGAMVMIDADTAILAPVYQGSIRATDNFASDVAGKRHVAILYIQLKALFEEIYGLLAIQILFGAAFVQMLTTAKEARFNLAQSPLPPVILVMDGAIARQKKLLRRVLDLLCGGATVVFAGYFGTDLDTGELDRMFATVGLPWTRGSYGGRTLRLQKGAAGNIVGRLPSAYTQTAQFLDNIGSHLSTTHVISCPIRLPLRLRRLARVGSDMLGT